mgnify:CR=1 FL=1
MCSSALKIPNYYAHFRSQNFVGKKNAHIQGKSAVYPVGLTSILTQYMGIFLRQNRVRICALWLRLYTKVLNTGSSSATMAFSVSALNSEESEKIYKTAEETLDYPIGNVTIRDIITTKEVEITNRNI